MGNKKQPGTDFVWNQTFNKKEDGLDLKKELSFKNTPRSNKFAIGLSPLTWARKFITKTKP